MLHQKIYFGKSNVATTMAIIMTKMVATTAKTFTFSFDFLFNYFCFYSKGINNGKAAI